MKKLLQFLVERIVEHPQDVLVKKEEKTNLLTLRLKVNADDLKIVIGKSGKTIRAIRELLHIKANKQGKKFNLVLEENQTKS